jgi:hypothetical protein
VTQKDMEHTIMTVTISYNGMERIMYEIILGKDIRPGNTIIYNSSKALVTSVHIGSGAGSFDFGTYILIKAVNHKNNDYRIEFWTFENCPVVKEIDERN